MMGILKGQLKNLYLRRMHGLPSAILAHYKVVSALGTLAMAPHAVSMA